MLLSRRIREVREERGLTLEQLGELVGKSGPTIHKYESGDIKNIKNELIEEIAEALSVSPAYLMGWTNIKLRGFFPTPVYSVKISAGANGKTKLGPLKTIIPDNQEAFLFVMKDQSMAPLIAEKAEVIVNTAEEICPGDIVCIQETPSSYPSLRKLEEVGEMTILRPINPDYGVEIFNEESPIAIIGKAISVKL